MMIVYLLGALALGYLLGIITMGIATSSSRADECHECPDRRFAQAVDDWRDGTDDD